MSSGTNTLQLQDRSHFEVLAGMQGERTILMDNTTPLKYSALLSGSDLRINVDTTREGSALELFLLTPVVEGKPTSVHLNLNLRHSRCKIDLHMVSLVFADAKNQASATIYMEQGIQESASTLLEETVILSDKVNVRNLPILDIQANEIAAAHGAKIYRLDPQKLFYLQSKGLSEQESRDLLISSYPNMLFDQIDLDEERKAQIKSDFLKI